MFLGSTALDVAIGLIFVYLVVSLICSSLSEATEALLKNRCKDLERGICEMLTGASQTSGATNQPNLVQAIYDHPLISGLFKGAYVEAKSKGDLPSYIPAVNFAHALLGTIRTETAGDKNAPLARLASDPAAAVAQLREAAVAFRSVNPKVSTALVAIIDAADDDVNRVRKGIERWFDSSMDRVSGWYKRRIQFVIFGYGLAIAAFANIDSIGIVRSLSTQAGVRDALVAQAGGFAAKQGGAAQQQQPATPNPNPGTPSQSVNADLNTLEKLRNLGLPLGWDNTDNRPRSASGGMLYYEWALKVVGILLTGFAVSLGAPFWFDLLNRFIVVRSTVKPTEKSPPEKSKE